jgi:hypothetical protein
VSIAQPFANLPNSIIAMRGSGILTLRDYSSNVRRMVEVLEKAEANVPSPGVVQRVKEAFGETNARPAANGRVPCHSRLSCAKNFGRGGA